MKSLMIFMVLAFFSSVFAWETDEKDKSMLLTPNLENGQQVYQVCIGCHSSTGWADDSDMARQHQPGFFPQIAGQHRNVIIKQLTDIRAGNRDNPMMYPFTLDRYIGGLQGIADVSAYISSLPSSSNHNIGRGYDLQLGKDLYRTNCTKCHGKNGEGDNEKFYPKLQGQHYTYLLRQFFWIRDGKRRNANTKMMRQIEHFTHREIIAVIDYVSRFKVTTAKTIANTSVTTEKEKK